MSTSSLAKIKIKVGPIELEYEGSPEFLKDGLQGLIGTMSSLAEKLPEQAATLSVADGSTVAATPSTHMSLSTSSIAARRGAKTGPELILCAMARIEISIGKASSSRSDILNEIKSATAYYNASMGSNLSASLTSLVKARKINEISKDTYALIAAERSSFEALIAQG